MTNKTESLSKISLLQNVFRFATRDPTELMRLKDVTTIWDEAIANYSGSWVVLAQIFWRSH
jgi:hypothetical protein